jgi:hypothetical protein
MVASLAKCRIKWYHHDAIKAGQDSSPLAMHAKISKVFLVGLAEAPPNLPTYENPMVFRQHNNMNMFLP